MNTSPRLRIAVIGAGNIGSTFAFQLACAGHHVTVVARPESARLAQLQKDMAIINVRRERAVVAVASLLDITVPYDLIVVTVLAYQVDAVMPALARCAGQHILFVFNNFVPERLQTRLGAARCDFGMPFVQASIRSDGRLDAKIGAGGQKTRLGNPRWVALFNAAGLPAVYEPDMMAWLRCQVPLCIAFESVSVAGMRRGGGASWHEAMALSHGMHQAYDIIAALGHPLYPAGKARLAASPAWVAAAMLWSMSRIASFRELLAGGANECSALVDTMTVAARAAVPPIDAAALVAMKPARASQA